MKKRTPIVIAVLSMSLTLLALSIGIGGTPSASAGDTLPTAAIAAASVVSGPAAAEFVGSTKCKKCHLAEHKSWEGLRHGKAFETLKPGNASEAKTKHKLDPAKDYTKDATCVACHTVGFGKPGGYQMPADEEGTKKMKPLEGVGCENCHGAGSNYILLHEEIMKSKRKYKMEEMYAAGAAKMEATVCLTCHNEKSPTVDPTVPFDYEKQKEKGVHERIPLKQLEQ
jgi:hypothetical protein